MPGIQTELFELSGKNTQLSASATKLKLLIEGDLSNAITRSADKLEVVADKLDVSLSAETLSVHLVGKDLSVGFPSDEVAFVMGMVMVALIVFMRWEMRDLYGYASTVMKRARTDANPELYRLDDQFKLISGCAVLVYGVVCSTSFVMACFIGARSAAYLGKPLRSLIMTESIFCSIIVALFGLCLMSYGLAKHYKTQMVAVSEDVVLPNPTEVLPARLV